VLNSLKIFAKLQCKAQVNWEYSDHLCHVLQAFVPSETLELMLEFCRGGAARVISVNAGLKDPSGRAAKTVHQHCLTSEDETL
jgi:hypothetical protein